MLPVSHETAWNDKIWIKLHFGAIFFTKGSGHTDDGWLMEFFIGLTSGNEWANNESFWREKKSVEQ
jgi:hypothetical protein